MRLINTSSLTLHNFNEAKIPAYAILSHTWGEEEVSFQNFEDRGSKTLAGYIKINNCCALARSDGWQYVWVDTCCIDKTSSAELSEAINSMYRWYKNAQVCYAYLVDITELRPDEFVASRWFNRGWTLQELLAPAIVIFYDCNWQEVGTKSSLRKLVSTASSIHYRHLANPTGASVAATMSWAAKRQTTRVEDIAYCLMGLFDVNMPLLYGEGQKAFQRMQEMILQKTSDESIFAWKDAGLTWSSLFARSPDAFAGSGDIRPRIFPRLYRRPSVMTNRGLEIDIHRNLAFRKGSRQHRSEQTITGVELDDQVLLLNCAREGADDPFMIPLWRRSEESYLRYDPTTLETWSLKNVHTQDLMPYESRREYIEMEYLSITDQQHRRPYLFLKLSPPHHGLSLIGQAQYGFMTWDNHKLNRRNDLDGWEITGHLDRMLFLFQHSDSEMFVLEVIRTEDYPQIQVYVPVKSDESNEVKSLDVDLDALETYFARATGADRLIEWLQDTTAVSLSVRKKLLDDEIFYVVEIEVLPGQANRYLKGMFTNFFSQLAYCL
ncbi:MAG: hypothetical protein Q9218_007013 [Villophora microphyllina]